MKQSEYYEAEAYDFAETRPRRFTLSRRAFVQSVGAGLLITTALPRLGLAQPIPGAAPEIAGRFRIDEDGTITVYTSKVEVGQGARTQIAQAAAEEFRVPLEQVRVLMADTALVPDDGGTFGSLTTPRTVPDVRQAAAAAREALRRLAGELWDVDPEAVAIRDGFIAHRDGQQMRLGELATHDANVQAGLNAGRSSELTPQADWRVLGQSPPKAGAEDMVTGRHQYPSDIRRDGMLYGKILRPPAFDAELRTLDTTAAEALEGVTVVRDNDLVGCTAPTNYQAARAIDLLAEGAQWDVPPHPSSTELYDVLKENTRPAGGGRRGSRQDESGDVNAALEDADQVLRATYKVPYIQHAPMETRAAMAEWDGGAVTVWTGTQRPHGVRGEVASAFSLPESRVRVIVPDTGGGFGGKHSGDAAVEAARLARALERPVTVQWTREEEFTWAYFRPAGLFEAAAAIQDRAVTAWDFTTYNAGPSGLASPYNFPNKRVHFLACDSPLREGSYRALASTANHFAREAFMDRIAHELGQDPLDFRAGHLDDGRLKDVLLAAAEAFGWRDRQQEAQEGRGFGIACGIEKGSYVAACTTVRVQANGRDYEIERLLMAYECGAIQNPKNLLAQVEGCIIQGLGAVLEEAIEFEDGKILNNRFATYHVPRFKNVPPLEIHLLDRPDLASAGAGETPIIPVAPALANALFDATGHPPDALPLRLA